MHLYSNLLHKIKPNKLRYHEIIAKNLDRAKTIINRKDKKVLFKKIITTSRIITFNYDTLLDGEVMKCLNLDVCAMYFDRLGINLADAESALKRKRKNYPFPYMVKLHGSINWIVKTEDLKMIIDEPHKIKNYIPIWIDNDLIPSPDDAYSPLVVPPLPNKPITKVPIFCHLWQCASEYLQECKRIIIVGYRCPPTDTMAVSLLSSVRNTRLSEIVIVNPDASVMSTFQNIMGNSIPKGVKWLYYNSICSYVESNRLNRAPKSPRPEE